MDDWTCAYITQEAARRLAWFSDLAAASAFTPCGSPSATLEPRRTSYSRKPWIWYIDVTLYIFNRMNSKSTKSHDNSFITMKINQH